MAPLANVTRRPSVWSIDCTVPASGARRALKAYGMHASNGILFNHESPLRGETFVSRTVTRGVAAIALGLQDRIYLGNLNAERDWGHARDYVAGMWRMLQQDQPGDYVLATGRAHSVRQLVSLAFAEAGIAIAWEGTGVDERGIDGKTGRVLVEVDPRYFRPTEVDLLLGDASKARRVLGWEATTSFEAMVAEMVRSDLELLKREGLRRNTDGGRAAAATP